MRRTKLPIQEAIPFRSRPAAEAHVSGLRSILHERRVRCSLRIFKRGVRADGEKVPVFVVIARWRSEAAR